MRRVLAGTALASVVLLAGCGSSVAGKGTLGATAHTSSPASSTAPSREPAPTSAGAPQSPPSGQPTNSTRLAGSDICSAVTPAETKEIFGVEVTGRVSPSSDLCDFFIPDGTVIQLFYSHSTLNSFVMDSPNGQKVTLANLPAYVAPPAPGDAVTIGVSLSKDVNSHGYIEASTENASDEVILIKLLEKIMPRLRQG